MITLDTIRTQLRHAKTTADWANKAALKAALRVRALEVQVKAYVGGNTADTLNVALLAEVDAIQKEAWDAYGNGPLWRLSKLADFMGAERGR